MFNWKCKNEQLWFIGVIGVVQEQCLHWLSVTDCSVAKHWRHIRCCLNSLRSLREQSLLKSKSTTISFKCSKPCITVSLDVTNRTWHLLVKHWSFWLTRHWSFPQCLNVLHELGPLELSGLSGGMIYVALLPSQASNEGQTIAYQEIPRLHPSCLVNYARGFTWQVHGLYWCL